MLWDSWSNQNIAFDINNIYNSKHNIVKKTLSVQYFDKYFKVMFTSRIMQVTIYIYTSA